MGCGLFNLGLIYSIEIYAVFTLKKGFQRTTIFAKQKMRKFRGKIQNFKKKRYFRIFLFLQLLICHAHCTVNIKLGFTIGIAFKWPAVARNPFALEEIKYRYTFVTLAR